MVEFVVGGEFGGPKLEHALLLRCEAEGEGGDFFLKFAGGRIEEGFLDASGQDVLQPGGEELALLGAIQARQIQRKVIVADGAITC